MEQKTKDLDIKMKNVSTDNQKFQDHMVMMDCKATETHLRLRVVPESLSENIHKCTVDIWHIFRRSNQMKWTIILTLIED